MEGEDVRWVITVPAIWRSAAKQVMREAAYAAGMASPTLPQQLLISLEPEAASLFCRQLKVSAFIILLRYVIYNELKCPYRFVNHFQYMIQLCLIFKDHSMFSEFLR